MVGEAAAKKNLYDAARKGELATFQQLLQQDPYLLDDVSFACAGNLLHVATIWGQAAIVEEVLKINPRLATSLDSRNSSSLHIAAEEESLEIVKKLLSVTLEACWWRDCHDMNPIHIAAMNGHDEVLKELLKESHSQLRALKFLVEKLGELVCAKDNDGETLLHLAVRSNQLEIVEYLVEHKITKTQTPNSMGKTELKILRESPRETSSYSEIHKILKKLQWWPSAPPAAYGKTTTTGTGPAKPSWYLLIPHCTISSCMIHNTTAFVASLATIFLIMTGLPSRHIVFFYLALKGMWLLLGSSPPEAYHLVWGFLVRPYSSLELQ